MDAIMNSTFRRWWRASVAEGSSDSGHRFVLVDGEGEDEDGDSVTRKLSYFSELSYCLPVVSRYPK